MLASLIIILCFPLIMPPYLPAVEQVLEDGIEGQYHRSQRRQVVVGHPDTHCSVFLAEKLAACDGVTVTVSDPFAEAKLDDAKEERCQSQPKDAAPVARTTEEDEIDGLSDGEQQSH